MNIYRFSLTVALAASVFFMSIFIPAPAQEWRVKKVTLEMNNVPIESVLEAIEIKTKVKSSVQEDLAGTIVSLKVEDVTADEAITALVADQNWVAIKNQLTGNYTIWPNDALPQQQSQEESTATPTAAEEPAPQNKLEKKGPVPMSEFVSPVPGESVEGFAPPPPDNDIQQENEITTATWSANEWGEIAFHLFQYAPYPHESRAEGWTYNDEFYPKDVHYSDSTVGVFLPKQYMPGDRINFVVHFHGWMNYAEKVFDDFGLDRQVAMSGVNTVLLVPTGPKLSRDSGGGKLQLDPGAFKSFIDEGLAFLKAEGKAPENAAVGDVVLTAHSGGYKTTSFILKHGGMNDHITDVLLFDATYADYENFVEWAAQGQNRRLVSIFTNHLREDNLEIMAQLTKKGQPFAVMSVGDMSPDTLKYRVPIFIYIPKEIEDSEELNHNKVVSAKDFYSLWISTTAPGKK